MRYIESETVELKETVTDNIKKEITAFANSRGGTIYVGVSDSGEVIGVDNADNTIQQISSMVRDSIKPDVTMFVHYERTETASGEIVKVSIQSGTNKPYYLSAKGLRPEGVYVRQGTSSVPSTDRAIREMIKETDGTSYEEMRSMEQELTFTEAEKQFGKRGMEFGTAKLRSLSLLSQDGVYNNGAYLLSDQCCHTIKLARFSGTTKSVFHDRRDFSGSVFNQMEESYKYIDMNNNMRSSFEGLYRFDRRDYPEEALREALLNSIVHRDYSVNSPTLISIFDDRIEFLSVGGLYGHISMTDVFMGISACRNPKLANVFYRLELIEAYGCGIQKIMDAYAGADVKPEIFVGDNSFKTVLPNLNFAEKQHSSMRVSESMSPIISDVHQDKTCAPGIQSMTLDRNLNPCEGMMLDRSLNPCNGVVLDKSTLRTMALAAEESDKEYEKKIKKYIEMRGKISRNEVERLLEVSQATSNRILRKMEREGTVARDGNGRSTRYKLK